MKSPDKHPSQNIINCNVCSLKHLCLPHGLNQNELAELETSIDKTIKIKKKQAIYHANDPCNGIYAIKSGSAKTSLVNADGQEQILEFHLPGDVLGFDAFATHTHSCDVIALEDTLVCRIPIEMFDSLCERSAGFRKVMHQQIGKEISHSQKLLLSLGQLATEERLASYLVQLANHYQSRGFSKTEFMLPMSRQDLSNYLGMAVETLSRILARLNKKGLVKIEQRRIIINDFDQLEALAHTAVRENAAKIQIT